jgi:hypothetical protein
MKPKLPKIDGDIIRKRHETKEDRDRVSLYLSVRIYEDFKKACGTASPSKVIEDLMELFTESINKQK